jgi:hypothetical protein
MDAKIYKNGKIEIVKDGFEEDVVEENSNDALNEFMTSLASADTNTIAKIRAVAQKFIDSTSEVSE